MSEIETGGPAFPVELHATTKDCMGFYGEVVKAGHITTYSGMTLRDYFAAKAMQGMIASPNCPMNANDETIAEQSYAMADAMLAERDKQK